MEITEVQVQVEEIPKSQKKRRGNRDASPIRAIVVQTIPRKHRSQCRACGATRDIEIGMTGNEWQCVGKCKNEDNHGCGATNADGSKMFDYDMRMFLHKITPSYKKVGILDVFPKICAAGSTVVRNEAKYHWYGLYHIVLEHATPDDEILPWLTEGQFKIVQRFNDRSLFVVDVKHEQREPIYLGVYPAERSIAMLELGRSWYHCDFDVKHRRPIQDILHVFEGKCTAMALVVGPNKYIEIPIRGADVLNLQDVSLYDAVERAYSMRESETKKTFACI